MTIAPSTAGLVAVVLVTSSAWGPGARSETRPGPFAVHADASWLPSEFCRASCCVPLQVIVRAAVPPSRLARALAETARVWAGHDVGFLWSVEPFRVWAPPLVPLRVVIGDPALESPRPAPPRPLRLASIVFLAPNRPRDVINVSVDAVEALVRRTTTNGRPLSSRAGLLQERFRVHALGRSLAHEIGHYLLASATHSAEGLMRATFETSELMDPAIGGFGLTEAEARTLRRPGGALAACLASEAGWR